MSVLENQGENPLLDSRFPDVSGKGRGYQIEAFSNGTPEWEELRKVSVWQTVSALEQVRFSRLFAARKQFIYDHDKYRSSEKRLLNMHKQRALQQRIKLRNPRDWPTAMGTMKRMKIRS